MKFGVLCSAVLLTFAHVSASAADEIDYKKRYFELVPKYEHVIAQTKMLQRQTREFRRILDRNGIDYSQEIVVMGDDGIIRERIDLSEDPWPVDLRTEEEKLTN